jgi:hypothetical protein
MGTTSDCANLKSIFKPLLEGDLLLWRGLPVISAESVIATFGQPSAMDETDLGWYPATCYTWDFKTPEPNMTVYSRNGELVLIETKVSPPIEILKSLGELSAILPHEFLIPGTYVHEYLYCQRGLVLSVAEPFQKELPLQIVRCRGIKIMSRAAEFGPEYYRSFEDETVW